MTFGNLFSHAKPDTVSSRLPWPETLDLLSNADSVTAEGEHFDPMFEPASPMQNARCYMLNRMSWPRFQDT